MFSFLLPQKHLITREKSLVIVDVSLIYGADLKKSLLGRPPRHAGMCPAAAAELEHEYRPGQVWVVSVALYCYIRFRGSYILIQCTMILSTYDC